MPAKSAKQLRWAYATAKGKTDAPPEVGREMIAQTSKKKRHAMMQHITKSGRVIRGGGR